MKIFTESTKSIFNSSFGISCAQQSVPRNGFKFDRGLFAKIFRNSISPPLNKNHPRSWENLLEYPSSVEKIFNRTIFGFGLGMVALNIYTFFEERQKYLDLNKTVPISSEIKEKIQQAKRSMQVEGISLVGTSASAVDWAYEAQLLSLGSSRSPIKGVSNGATILVSGYKGVFALQFLRQGYEKFKKKVPEAAEKVFIEKNRIALCDLIAYGSSCIWALSELISLLFGAALAPFLSEILIVLSIGFGLVSIFYKMHLEKNKK